MDCAPSILLCRRARRQSKLKHIVSGACSWTNARTPLPRCRSGVPPPPMRPTINLRVRQAGSLLSHWTILANLSATKQATCPVKATGRRDTPRIEAKSGVLPVAAGGASKAPPRPSGLSCRIELKASKRMAWPSVLPSAHPPCMALSTFQAHNERLGHAMHKPTTT